MTSETPEPVAPESATSPDPAADPAAEAAPQPAAARPRSWEPSPTFLNGALAVALAVIIGGIGYSLGRAAGPDGWPGAPAGWRGADHAHPEHPGEVHGNGHGRKDGHGRRGGEEKDGPRRDWKPGDRPGWQPGNDQDTGWQGLVGSPLRGTVASITADRLSLRVRGGLILELAVSEETSFQRLTTTGLSAAPASDVVPNARVWVIVERPSAGDSIAVPTVVSVTILP